MKYPAFALRAAAGTFAHAAADGLSLDLQRVTVAAPALRAPSLNAALKASF